MAGDDIEVGYSASTASGHGRSYLAHRDQTIIEPHIRIEHLTVQLHAREERLDDANEGQEKVDKVIQLLLHTERVCLVERDEFDELLRKARSEGRAEAQREAREQIDELNTRLAAVQARLKKARDERDEFEQAIVREQQEAERVRRELAAMREAAETAASQHTQNLDTAPGRGDAAVQEFDRLMAFADAELTAARHTLERLSDDLDEPGPTIVPGEIVESTSAPDTAATSTPVHRGDIHWESANGHNGTGSAPILARAIILPTVPLPFVILGTCIKMIFSAPAGPTIFWAMLFVVPGCAIALIVGLFLTFLGIGWSRALTKQQRDRSGYICLSAGTALVVVSAIVDLRHVVLIGSAAHFLVTTVGPM